MLCASKEKIKQMIDEGHFIPPQEAYPYIDELFEIYKSIF